LTTDCASAAPAPALAHLLSVPSAFRGFDAVILALCVYRMETLLSLYQRVCVCWCVPRGARAEAIGASRSHSRLARVSSEVTAAKRSSRRAISCGYAPSAIE
jgi:hypothetical protein